MSAFVVFLDTDNARIFEVSPGKTTTKILHRTEMKHHTSSDPANHKDTGKFFNEVAGKLSAANEILILGPGLAKDHFMSHLKEHHRDSLAARIVGLQTVDHPSDEQILDQSRKFFRVHDLYN